MVDGSRKMFHMQSRFNSFATQEEDDAPDADKNLLPNSE